MSFSETLSLLETPFFPLPPTLPAEYYPSFKHFDPESLPPGYQYESPSSEYAVFQETIEKGNVDHRTHRLIRLSNGLEALCISDPKVERSAACINVRIGSHDEPEKFPGLAHFLEHLLFMGSKKYPSESYYTDFLSSHGGHANAYTTDDETSYHFSVSSAALFQALDIIANLFVSPLFDMSCVEREIKAVDSEFKGHLSDDSWRLNRLQSLMSNPAHPASRFTTGNLDTLWNTPREDGIDIRQELIDFHANSYSANLMKIVVIGKEPIDQLCDMINSLFKNVPNKSVPPRYCTEPKTTSAELEKIVHYQSIKDSRDLQINFPFPDQTLCFASRPSTYLSYFLGHEGQGSLFSVLKNKGYILAISVGTTTPDNSDKSIGNRKNNNTPQTQIQSRSRTLDDFLSIDIELTQDGFTNYLDVLNIVFQYIDYLKSNPISESTFHQLSYIYQLNFDFKEPADPYDEAMDLAKYLLSPLPRRFILSGSTLLRHFDREAIEKSLQLLTLENSQIFLSGPGAPPSTIFDRCRQPTNDHLFEFDYHALKIDGPLKMCITYGDAVSFSLPAPNEFLPKNLDLITDTDSNPKRHPRVIYQSVDRKIWHNNVSITQWKVPKVDFMAKVANPAMNDSPLSTVMTSLFLMLVQDTLDEHTYPATLAGLEYSFRFEESGVIFHMSGYNDKMKLLLDLIASKVGNFKVDSHRFEILRHKLIRVYENESNHEQPSELAYERLRHLLCQRVWLPKDKIKCMYRFSSEDLQFFIQSLMQNVYKEEFFNGNLSEQDAMTLVHAFDGVFRSLSLPWINNIRFQRVLIPPPGSKLVHKVIVPDESEVNSSVLYYVYIGPTQKDIHLRACLILFNRMLLQHTDNVLRTKEQLGYYIESERLSYCNGGGGSGSSGGYDGFLISVQGEQPVEFLESRIRAFLADHVLELLETIDDSELEQQRTAAIDRAKENFKNMFEESEYFWSHIVSGDYEFDSKTNVANALKDVSRADLIEFYHKYISPSSKTQTKISVQFHSKSLHEKVFEPLFTFLRANNLPVDDLEDLVEESPTASMMAESWPDMFREIVQNNNADLAALLPQSIRIVDNILQYTYTVPGDDSYSLNKFEPDSNSIRSSATISALVQDQ